MGRPLVDLVGEVFGLLTVIGLEGRRSTPSGEPLWRCRCACGEEIVERRSRLKSGRTRYCRRANHKSEFAAAQKRAWNRPKPWARYRSWAASVAEQTKENENG